MSVGSVFKAISDPTRREILKLLNEKDLSAGEIAEHFDISKPALTKHLNILREAELVSSEKQGNFVIYSLNVTVLQQALYGFMSIFGKKE
ncbi:ArsR family transcriptional regulator [Bifidobacterium longum]|uniref:ArsR family transcriptional regulator n=1 Tax=Bifidobacterium longum TaxID=216816 RepID=A0A2U2RSP0_BIFLN|nr:ArsR family transcriptional regulator [Bifidobacterium longum]